MYEGQSINSDDGSISQKILLESKLFVKRKMWTCVAYSCLKYGVFIMNRSDVVRICMHHCARGHEYLHFDQLCLGVG